MLDGFFHYEFLDGRLIGSEHPAARGSARQRVASMLVPPGRTALLTLTDDFERYALPDLVQYHLPLSSPPRLGPVAEIVGLIDAHLACGDRVWVHCLHGLDRTGCVIGAYLCQRGAKPDQVIDMLLDRYPARRRQPRMLELWRPFADFIRSFAAVPNA